MKIFKSIGSRLFYFGVGLLFTIITLIGLYFIATPFYLIVQYILNLIHTHSNTAQIISGLFVCIITIVLLSVMIYQIHSLGKIVYKDIKKFVKKHRKGENKANE